MTSIVEDNKLLLAYLAGLSWAMIWIGIHVRKISTKLGIKTDEITELKGMLFDQRPEIASLVSTTVGNPTTDQRVVRLA